MSGILAAWNRDGAPVDRGVFGAMLDTQHHRAIDGQDTWTSPDGSVMLAHMHFWTTPEEQGENQPLVADGIALAFDGRLDNRSEIAEALRMPAGDVAALSDAALVLEAYRRWDDGFFERLLGSFAVVVVDWGRRRIVFGRDSLGRRTLCYHMDGSRLLIASEPSALIAHPSVPDGLDDVYLAHLYALRAPADGETPFAAVREVRPAHVWHVKEDDATVRRFWTPDPTARIRYNTDAEYTEHFGEVFKRAVHRRLRAPAPPALMMSGGLDSTAIAGLASEMLTAEGRGPLKTVSWLFDEIESLDEREYIEAMIERHGMDATFIVADGEWPFRGLETWPHDPNGPEPNVYRNLLDRGYRAALADGNRVVLTGAAGDGLYLGAESWVVGLIEAGRSREALRELREHARRLGWKRVLRSKSVRRVARMALRRIGIRRATPIPPVPEWMNSRSRELLPADSRGWADGHDRPEQWVDLIGAEASHHAISFGFHAHRLGMDLRDPYFDRDLVELALQFPPHQLYNGGRLKVVLRRAMRDVLPESIIERRVRSDFSPLFRIGARREGKAIEKLVNRPDALWRRFVNQQWVSIAVPGALQLPREEIALWFCASMERWLEQRSVTGSEWTIAASNAKDTRLNTG